MRFTSWLYRSRRHTGTARTRKGRWPLSRGKSHNLGARSSTGAREFGAISDLAAFDPFADSATLRNSQIVIVLQIEPKLCGQVEVLSQADGSVGTDGAVSADDLVDAGKVERFRQCIGAYVHWLHELCFENFSRVNCKHS